MEQEKLEQILGAIPGDLLSDFRSMVKELDGYQNNIDEINQKISNNENIINEQKLIYENPYQVDYLREKANNQIELLNKEQLQLRESLSSIEKDRKNRMSELQDFYTKIKNYFNENRVQLNKRFIEVGTLYERRLNNLANLKKNINNFQYDPSDMIKNLEDSIALSKKEYQELLNLNNISVQNLTFFANTSFWNFLDLFKKSSFYNLDKNVRDDSLEDLTLGNGSVNSESVALVPVYNEILDNSSEINNVIDSSLQHSKVESKSNSDSNKDDLDLFIDSVLESLGVNKDVDKNVGISNNSSENSEPENNLEENTDNDVILLGPSSLENGLNDNSEHTQSSQESVEDEVLPILNEPDSSRWEKFKNFIKRNKVRMIAGIMVLTSATIGLSAGVHRSNNKSFESSSSIPSVDTTDEDTLSDFSEDKYSMNSDDTIVFPDNDFEKEDYEAELLSKESNTTSSVVQNDNSETDFVHIGDTVNIEDGVPIFSNVYDAYSNQNGLQPYFGAGIRTVIGICLEKDGKIQTVYASTNNYNDVIDNLISSGWSVISYLTTHDNIDINNMSVKDIQDHAEGFYSADSLFAHERSLGK